jgi:hypothetical protein
MRKKDLVRVTPYFITRLRYLAARVRDTQIAAAAAQFEMRLAITDLKDYGEACVAAAEQLMANYDPERGAAPAPPTHTQVVAAEAAPAPHRTDDPDAPGCSMPLNPAVIGSALRPPMPEAMARSYLTSERIDAAIQEER